MIKFELPENDMSVMFHIGEAFRKIAIDAGYPVPASTDVKTTVTHAVGEVSHTVTTEPVDTRSPAQIDQDDSDREDALKTPFAGYDASSLDKQAATIGIVRKEAVKPMVQPELELETPSVMSDAAVEACIDEPVAVTPPVITDDKLDKDGVPWDARIHSRGKTRNVDNTWRVSRAPKDQTKEQFAEFVESVKTELLALMEIPVADPDDNAASIEDITQAEINAGNLPPIITPATSVPVAAITPPVIEQSAAAKAFDTPVIEQSAAAKAFDTAVVTPAVVTPAIVTPAIVTPAIVTPAIVTPAATLPVSGVPATFGELMKFITTSNKKLTTDIVKQTLVDNGVAALPLLASRLDLIPQIHAALVAKL